MPPSGSVFFPMNAEQQIELGVREEADRGVKLGTTVRLVLAGDDGRRLMTAAPEKRLPKSGGGSFTRIWPRKARGAR